MYIIFSWLSPLNGKPEKVCSMNLCFILQRFLCSIKVAAPSTIYMKKTQHRLLLKDSEIIVQAMTSPPIRAASTYAGWHSVQPSQERFPISVVFMLPLSLLCSKAYRASRADWRKEVLALTRQTWLTPLRWSTASENFTVTLGCAEGSKMAEPWYIWKCESVLTCGNCKSHFGLHIKVSNLKGAHCGCGSEFALIGSYSNITTHYLLPLKPLRH